MKRVKVVFRATHYYRILGGTEACPHTHTYTVEVACAECDEVGLSVEGLKAELDGSLLNDWKGLLYPEPTTENLALSIYALLPRGKVEWISVQEDDLVKSVYDGRDIWVVLLRGGTGYTAAVGVKGSMDSRGFATDLRDLYRLLREEGLE